MAVYCVNYDLIDEKNYPKIQAELKKYPNWIPALKSAWFIATEELRLFERQRIEA